MGPIRSQQYRFTASEDVRAAGDAKPVGAFRVASYNVENLFDAIDDPDRRDEDTPPKDEEGMRRLAQALKKADADVVALQEVENLQVLNQFLDKHMPGVYPHRVLVEGNDMRGIDVAVISKHPVDKVESHKGNRFQVPDGSRAGSFKRDFLKVDVRVGRYPFSVYTTHFKAQSGGKVADDHRLGEAREAKRILEADMRKYPERRFVVTGDFNDTPDSPVGRVFLPRDRNQWHLNDALAEVPKSQRITHPVTKRSIDFVLYPDSMQAEFLGGGIQRLPETERGSDHLLIYADFRFQNSPSPEA